MEKLGGYGVKFGTKLKWRMPVSIVDYLLSAFEFKRKVQGIAQEQRQPISATAAAPAPDTIPAPAAMVLQPRLLKAWGEYPVNEVKSFNGILQLILSMDVELQNGQLKRLRMLVDTGAEANLIKVGLIPTHLTYPAKKILRLVAANGQAIRGGDRTVVANLKFMQEVGGVRLKDTLNYSVEFWEADIEVDAILSFPWMCENRLGIFPHHRALAKDHPVFTLLYGHCVTKRNREGNQVGMVGVEPESLEVAGTSQGESQNLNMDMASSSISVSTGEPQHPQPQPAQPLNIEAEPPGTLLAHKLNWLDFQLPPQSYALKKDRLLPHEAQHIARQLQRGERRKIEALIEVNDTGEGGDPRIPEFTEKIIKRFGETVLTGKIIPDPPVRGPYGYAYILLKENADPQRQKPFKMHGEREEAHKQITEDWISHKFLERPPPFRQEWLHQSFPVEKKSPTFPWRGVVDMRGVNSQSKRVNYPLPKIEDLLIKQGGNHIFSIIDLKQAFHQQPLHPDSRPYTCTYTPWEFFNGK